MTSRERTIAECYEVADLLRRVADNSDAIVRIQYVAAVDVVHSAARLLEDDGVELERLRFATEWHPIETAPKDRPVAYRSKLVTIGACRWWTAEQLAQGDPEYGPDSYHAAWYDLDQPESEVCPTHWRPLHIERVAADG